MLKRKFLKTRIMRVTIGVAFAGILNMNSIQSASAVGQIHSVLFEVNASNPDLSVNTNEVTTLPTLTVGDSITVKIEAWGSEFRNWNINTHGAISLSDAGNDPNQPPLNNWIYFTGIATTVTSSTTIDFSIEAKDGTWATLTTSFQLAIIGPASSSNSSSDSTDQLKAEEAHRAAVTAAKATIVGTVNALKAPTLADYRAAEYAVNTQATVDRINTQVLDLQGKTPAVPLTELQIAPIVKKESFVEYVSTEATQGSVQARQLVENAVVAADYKYKTSLLRVIKGTATTNLDSYAKIKALVDAEIARIQARKDRITALTKKVNG